MSLSKGILIDEMIGAINDSIKQACDDSRGEWLVEDNYYLSFDDGVLTVAGPDDEVEKYKLNITLTKV